MAYDQIQNNLDITIDSLSTEEIINFVKNQAKSNNIRFGSIESAAYHMIIHSVDPIESYVRKANQFVANDNVSTSIINNDAKTIDVKFFDPQTGEMCVILVKNGAIMIKTYMQFSKINRRN